MELILLFSPGAAGRRVGDIFITHCAFGIRPAENTAL